jgi:hypothetical protein
MESRRRIYNSHCWRHDNSFRQCEILDFAGNDKENTEMKRSVLACLFLVVLIVGSMAQSSGPTDENLSFKTPIPDEGWNASSGKSQRESADIMRWQKTNEWFQAMILHANRIREPERYRNEMDAYHQKSSSDFQSTLLKQGLVNNYPMIFWQTKATLKDGTKSFDLILYIQGKDASYQIVRRWDNTEVSDSDKQRWVDYMKSIYVFDTRYPEHQSQKPDPKHPGVYQEFKNMPTVKQPPAKAANTVTNN